jgi:hypothetical protein
METDMTDTTPVDVTIEDEIAGTAYGFDPDYEPEPKISAFARYERKAWPHTYTATIDLYNIAGGIPSNPKIAEDWIRKQLGAPSEEIVRAQVAETMKERGIDADAAAAEVARNKTLNGFKRHSDKGLFIEGRQLKAAIKEAVGIAVAANKIEKSGWGTTNKGIWAFAAEHICVVEDRLYLGRKDADEVVQRFVSTWRGTGINYSEVCHEVVVTATIKTDYEFKEETWAMIFLTGGEQGLGAGRSQGFGRYVVTGWEKQSS